MEPISNSNTTPHTPLVHGKFVSTQLRRPHPRRDLRGAGRRDWGQMEGGLEEPGPRHPHGGHQGKKAEEAEDGEREKGRGYLKAPGVSCCRCICLHPVL